MIEGFEPYLGAAGLSKNTVKTYVLNVEDYLAWHTQTFGTFTKLYEGNVLEYVDYLRERRQDGKTINNKLFALARFNAFLIHLGVQTDKVVLRRSFIRIQKECTNPNSLTKAEVEAFRQRILETGNLRNHAIVTFLAYGGLRISECLDLQLNDLSLASAEVLVRHGKGNKQRVVPLSDKILIALRAYLRNRKSNSTYLFVSKNGDRICRSAINKLFNGFSDFITPHSLRHFFCSMLSENGFSAYEIAAMAGHSSVTTSMAYVHPSKARLREKLNQI